jgi:hypothetical protein
MVRPNYRNPMQGRRHDQEARLSISRHRSSCRWMHNGKKQKAVPTSEIEWHQEQGWVFGRLGIQGRKWINDRKGKCKCVPAKDVVKYTYLGWSLGRSNLSERS